MKHKETLFDVIMRYVLIGGAIMLTLCMLFSCTAKKSVIKTVTVHDTIIKETVRIDTIEKFILVKERPKSSLEYSFEPPKPGEPVKVGKVEVASGKNTMTVEHKDDGLIYVKADCEGSIDSIQKLWTNKYELAKVEHIKETESILKEKKVTTVWNKWTYIFLVTTILLIVILFSRMKKIFPNII